jgi:hypothetical protein
MVVKKKENDRVLKLDMSDAGSGGGGTRIEPGEYRLQVLEVTREKSKEEGNPYLKWKLKGMEGAAKGKTFFFNTSLLPQSLWKLRETLIGLGVEVPEDEIELNLDDLEGLEGVALMEDGEPYQGRVKSEIMSFAAQEDAAPEEKKRGNGKSKVVKVSEEEVGDMAEDDLETLIQKASLEVELGDYKTLSKKRAAVIAALEEAKLLEA